MQERIWSCFVFTAIAPYSFAPIQIHSTQRLHLLNLFLYRWSQRNSSQHGQILCNEQLHLLLSSYLQLLVSVSLYIWKRDGGMKWWNREQINNFIWFNILRTTQEADQEKERWICERCSFLFLVPPEFYKILLLLTLHGRTDPAAEQCVGRNKEKGQLEEYLWVCRKDPFCPPQFLPLGNGYNKVHKRTLWGSAMNSGHIEYFLKFPLSFWSLL